VGLTTGAAADAWPPLACDAGVKACLDASTGEIDLTSCGDYASVVACAGAPND
jgi:hypothetical protein